MFVTEMITEMRSVSEVDHIQLYNFAVRGGYVFGKPQSVNT